MKKLAVVALGGNALIHDKEKGTIDDQEKNMYETCRHLVQLIELDYNLVITKKEIDWAFDRIKKVLEG